MATTGETLGLSTFPAPLGHLSQVFRLRGLTLTGLLELLGMQALRDGTGAVRGCLGEEPKAEGSKQKDHRVLGRNKHGKGRAMVTRGTGHL